MLLKHISPMQLPKHLIKVEVIAKAIILLGIMSFLLCMSLLNKCLWAASLLIIFSGALKQELPKLLNHKVILMGIGMIILFTISLAYTQGSHHEVMRTWVKYLKIGYLICFLPLFTEKNNRNSAIYCFLIGVMLAEIITYLHHFGLIEWGFSPSKHWLFAQDIDASFIVAFSAFLFINLAIDNTKWRWLTIICFILCVFDLLFLNQERTGYLLVIALSGLCLMQRFEKRGLIIALLLIPLIFISLYSYSSKFNQRITQVATNVTEYQQGNQETSIGLRLAFVKYSLAAINHHWLFGLGTGSFETIYKTLNGPKINGKTWPAHPHNEYIAILFQLGLIGLGSFLLWLAIQIKAAAQLPKPEKYYLQGLILAFVLLSFCNASLLVNPAGDCYILLLAIFLGANYPQRISAVRLQG